MWPQIILKTASIDKVYLGYYMKAASEEQDYLLPVYVFEGEAIGYNENETEKFVHYIPASPELGIEVPSIK